LAEVDGDLLAEGCVLEGQVRLPDEYRARIARTAAINVRIGREV
jgi:hypothetical protein